MLTNLKELDLSFNYIERIQNLEKLVNLEVLSLFQNLITKLENLDALEKLVILSIGNNLIETTDGVSDLPPIGRVFPSTNIHLCRLNVFVSFQI